MENKDGAKRLGQAIKSLRLMTGMKRPQFEAEFGVDDGYLNNIERGMAMPSLDTLVVIARGLNISPGFLTNVFAGNVDISVIKDPNLLRRLAVTDQDVDIGSEEDLAEIRKLEQIRVLSEELINQKRGRFSIKNIDD